MADVVLLGAGLAGISAAYHLEQLGFTDYALFEKEEHVGGLCSSVEQDGFTFDYTGHLLHINDPYFKTLIETQIGFEHFNVIDRRSFVYSHERYTPYPYQMNLHGLPLATISDCIEGFVKRNANANPKNFEQWVLKEFGEGFAKHFFRPYQQKIFDCPLTEVTSSWTGRFVPQTTLQEIIAGALGASQPAVGYNAQFFYPKRGGILFWVNKLYEKLQRKAVLDCTVTKIDTVNKRIYFQNGHSHSYTTLINTLPLDRFLKMLQGDSQSARLNAAAHKLRCNSVMNFNLGIDRPNLSDKHWIYFPETAFPFYRIGFGHNFSEYATPPGCSSLYGEFAYLHRSQEYVQETLTCALEKTKKLFNISQADVVTEKIIPISHAYVIYDHWREKNLPKILRMLEEQNIYSIGRYGAWKYCSMQETLLDGKETANRVLKTI